MRDHDQIDALWRDSGPAQVLLEPGKAAEGWAEFLTKPVSTRIRSRPVSTTNGLFVAWITGCMNFAFNTGASSASEAFVAKIGPTGIGP
jgi:hypothetical protein